MQYLDGLFERDPKAGGENHERQVELYAKYDAEKLLPFLRSCNDIPLQKVQETIKEPYLLIKAGPESTTGDVFQPITDLVGLIPSSFGDGNEPAHVLFDMETYPDPAGITSV